MTRQRAVVLEVIRSDKCHHTADEIFKLAKELLPGISRGTVYNNLKALEEEKIIRRISGDGGADRYDSAFKPHGHIICTECGRVWDFAIEGFDSTLASAIGMEVDSSRKKTCTFLPHFSQKRTGFCNTTFTAILPRSCPACS